MTSAVETRPEPRNGRGTFWALVPVVLLVVGVGGVGTLASIAVRDPGFALEQNYYQRAVHFDAQQAEWAQNAQLGYRVASDVHAASDGVELVTRLTDRSGAPIRGAALRVEAFANARSGDRQERTMSEVSAGTYRAALGAPRPGLWELRFEAVADGQRFTAIERVDMPARSLP